MLERETSTALGWLHHNTLFNTLMKAYFYIIGAIILGLLILYVYRRADAMANQLLEEGIGAAKLLHRFK
jgi:hypothetical protein